MTTVNKVKTRTFELEEIEEMMENYEGACIVCGEVRECCEPDAREYECDNCGGDTVYGAEELLMMGLVV